MSIYDSRLWISDIDEVIKELPEMNDLENKSIMVTGCTGLICSAVVDVLIRWNMVHENKIRIIAAGRNKKKALQRFTPFSNEEWFSFVPFDASSAGNSIEVSCDYVIHGASNASPGIIMNEPVETMLSNIIGTNTLLEFAKDNNVKRVLFISSSEVYGQKRGMKPFRTDEYGLIDLLNARNSYAIGKRAAETMCVSYYDEYDVAVVIVRPGHVYGPTALESDNRVSSRWAYDVSRGKDIVMKSDGSQVRSYCYCLDSASAIIKVLIKGNNAHAYNISNPKSVISIRRMAEILADSAGVELIIDTPTEEEKKAFNPMRNSSLDSRELSALGWEGLFDGKRGLSHTVEIMKDMIV